jgi:hypothetical protein
VREKCRVSGPAAGPCVMAFTFVLIALCGGSKYTCLIKPGLSSSDDETYDAFEHLASALFWEADRPILMLTFYADDAGKKDDNRYVVAAGYIGLRAQWDRFCVDWRLLLASKGLPYFHATDFFTGADVFAGWNTENRKRERETLLKNLGAIIEASALYSFACIVDVASWFRANEKFLLDECDFAPFPLAARMVVQRTRQWAEANGREISQILYVFDKGCEDWGQLLNRLKFDFATKAYDEDKYRIRPLQAADWLAYETYRDASNVFGSEPTSSLRGSYGALLGVPNEQIPIRYRSLINDICEVPGMNIPRRSVHGSAAVRVKYDNRRMKIVQRRFRKLRKRLDSYMAAHGLNAQPECVQRQETALANPTLVAIQQEVDNANTMRDMYRTISAKVLAAMREDNRDNQEKLFAEFTDAMRAEREWTEKWVAALERFIATLESSAT